MMETENFLVLPLFLVRFPNASTTFLPVKLRGKSQPGVLAHHCQSWFSHSACFNVNVEKSSTTGLSSEQDYSLVRLDHALSLSRPANQPTLSRVLAGGLSPLSSQPKDHTSQRLANLPRLVTDDSNVSISPASATMSQSPSPVSSSFTLKRISISHVFPRGGFLNRAAVGVQHNILLS